MRRGVGLGAIKNKSLAQAKFKDKGNEIAEDQIAQMSKQMEAFRSNLEDFASKHKNEIRKNAEFRTQFQEMCASIGVDPLASSKGFWSEMLGVGDFYYELGVQIIEVCLATAHRNGGLMDLSELHSRLQKSRGQKSQDIAQDDLLRAIRKLKSLGDGFTLLTVGDRYMVQSVPGELSMDHTQVLQTAQVTGYVTRTMMIDNFKWETERVDRALGHMIKEGLAWIDDPKDGERRYWFPAFFTASLAT